jgi:protein-disulfide isomerase
MSTARASRLPALAARDNGRVSEAAVKPMPRRGRLWVIAALALVLFGLGYLVVEIATQKEGPAVVHVEGIGDAQRIFGGVPQEGDRLGSSDAPVTIQVFNDMQCSDCREDFLGTIPALTEDFARPGDVQLLYRHYSNSENAEELSFYGAEAAAEQGYGWQYVYLFFRNQGEAGHFGVDQDFLDSIAGGVEELNGLEWEEDLEDNGGPDGSISKRLEGYEELGRDLGIRVRQAMIVSGPNGTETLQDGPSLGQVERAIEAVQ